MKEVEKGEEGEGGSSSGVESGVGDMVAKRWWWMGERGGSRGHGTGSTSLLHCDLLLACCNSKSNYSRTRIIAQISHYRTFTPFILSLFTCPPRFTATPLSFFEVTVNVVNVVNRDGDVVLPTAQPAFTRHRNRILSQVRRAQDLPTSQVINIACT